MKTSLKQSTPPAPTGRRNPARRAFVAAGVALLTVAGTSACSSGTADAIPTSMDALVKQATQEGEVNWSAAKPMEQMQPAITLFEKKYPGITVKYTDTKAPDLASQLKVQEAARKVSIDVANAVGQSVLPSDTLAQDVDWSTYGVDDGNVFEKNFVYSWAAPKVWAYNTDKVSDPSVLPTTWEGLLDPRWASGVVAADSAAQFMTVWGLDPALGTDAGTAWAKEFTAQDPHFTANVNEAEAAVESGQVSMGASLINLVLAAQAKGAPVALAPVSPTNISEGYLYVPKGAPNPAAGVLLTAFLSSDEAQAALATTYNSRIPLTTDCSNPDENAVVAALCAAGVEWEPTPTLADYKTLSTFFSDAQDALGTLG